MYRGDGAGGWLTGTGERIGAGWQDFTALASGGDFSGDGKPDVLARKSDGVLLMYRGNGASGWLTGAGEPIGAGWGSFSGLTMAALWQPPPAPPAPPSAPVPDGRVRLRAGIRCTPPGGRLRVSLRVRARPGRPAPRVLKVVFFARGGPRKPTGAHRTSRGSGSTARPASAGASTRASPTGAPARSGFGTRPSRAAS